jgi:MFS family permease
MSRVQRAVVGGCALALGTGWNTANTGAVAQSLADVYGVGLATVGLFTTALFLTHLALQIPGGKASERFGPRRVGLAGLVVIACASAISLAAHEIALTLAARALTGVGTGLSFIAGSAYVRSQGGSPFAQGLFGGVGLAGGGVALAVVPPVEDWIGWRAPFATSLCVAIAGLAVLAFSPRDARRTGTRAEAPRGSGVLADTRLYALAVLYAASLGLSIVVGNWTVTLLHRQGGLDKGTAGVIGALTLVLGIVTRPLGGWILHTRPDRTRAAVGASLLAGAAGTALLAAARPVPIVVVGAALVGLAAGIPFSPAFTGAARTRPDASGAAVGFVNGAASAVAIVGTPLLGLTFSLPGSGRTGFAAVAALWLVALALLPTRARLGVVLDGEAGLAPTTRATRSP